MTRVRHNPEHPAEPATITVFEERALDLEEGKDEETETPADTPKGIPAEASAEPIGIDDDPTPIEEWQASCMVHEAAVEYHRVAPEIPEHPRTSRQAQVHDSYGNLRERSSAALSLGSVDGSPRLVRW
jgi:hypothetical protein